MEQSIRKKILDNQANSHKSLAILIDPDKIPGISSFNKLIHQCVESQVDFFLVGGSLITSDKLNTIIKLIKERTALPVILFPGNFNHLSNQADAILFLSLISGRNPDLLIGQQVIAAPYIKNNNLEAISTGYILVDAGRATTVSYMSQTTPIPANKPEIAACTALAGQYLGLQQIYLDAGSGAEFPVPMEMIKEVKKQVDIPLVVGGGLNTSEKALQAVEAGADMIVMGNGIESSPNLVTEVSSGLRYINNH